jgi:hypothetical protein
MAGAAVDYDAHARRRRGRYLAARFGFKHRAVRRP